MWMEDIFLMYIICGVYDLYMKVGRIAAAGGKVYSVDEGLLELPIL